MFEQRALEHLLGQGLRLLERNWHCRFGEIDLIMNDGDTLVFVEVRKRGSAQFGGAAASITATKLSKISASASLYLTKFQTTPPCRIDAVIFDSASASRLAEPTWMKNISQ
ncbi:MAG: YraN family protein [Betaproteobacteria bacterium]|nr:MAG: YraN family protein [Betaproteobacteria bacterium]